MGMLHPYYLVEMTERDKMLAGLMYSALDAELCDDRARAKELCFDYNHTRPSESCRLDSLLRELLGSVGENICLLAPFHCDYGYNIKIGDNFFANHNLVMLDCAEIRIGNNVFVAPNCGFYTAGHPLDAKERNSGLEYARPITIGNDVWIGAGVHILPGVTVGDGVVVGAGSVVTKDIPPYSLAVGNPCRVIRSICR